MSLSLYSRRKGAVCLGCLVLALLPCGVTPGILPSALRASLRLFYTAPGGLVRPLRKPALRKPASCVTRGTGLVFFPPPTAARGHLWRRQLSALAPASLYRLHPCSRAANTPGGCDQSGASGEAVPAHPCAHGIPLFLNITVSAVAP